MEASEVLENALEVMFPGGGKQDRDSATAIIEQAKAQWIAEGMERAAVILRNWPAKVLADEPCLFADGVWWAAVHAAEAIRAAKRSVHTEKQTCGES